MPMPDMGRGIIAPANGDNIGTGASEMRTLASTAATAIDVLAAQKADQSTVDGLATEVATKASAAYVDAGLATKSDVGHTHSVSEVEGLEDAFDVAYAGDGTWDVAETPLQALTDQGRLPTAAAAHAEQITRNIVDTSHLALDVDGTPFFQPGSMSLRLLQDIDGNPYFQETS